MDNLPLLHFPHQQLFSASYLHLEPKSSINLPKLLSLIYSLIIYFLSHWNWASVPIVHQNILPQVTIHLHVIKSVDISAAFNLL